MVIADRKWLNRTTHKVLFFIIPCSIGKFRIDAPEKVCDKLETRDLGLPVKKGRGKGLIWACEDRIIAGV